MSHARVVVADIGGTNLRLALAERQGARWRIYGVQIERARAGVNFTRVLRDYLAKAGNPEVQACAVCAAGPPDTAAHETSIRLTNLRCTIDTTELRAGAGVQRAALLNDFAAIALAVPLLSARERRSMGVGRAQPGAPIAVLGSGTGLGVSALIPHGPQYICVSGEGGHVDLCPKTDTEIALRRLMRGKALDAEAVLSGPGLVRLHRAVCKLRGARVDFSSAEQIAAAALQGRDATARETLRIFTEWFGRHAGNVALTYGARGGVYLAGGIIPAWGGNFDARAFRRGFEDKGRFRAYLRRIPSHVITHPQPALLGLAGVAGSL